MKLNRYGIQIKQWLKNEYPIRYQELILDGTLMEKIYERQNEVKITSTGLDNSAMQDMHVEGESAPNSSNMAKAQPIVNNEPKVGRNDPCPCGSGKKYKNCCGKNQ